VTMGKDGLQRLQVFNLKGTIEELEEGIRRTLEGLQSGASLEFPDSLTEEQREVLRKVATEMGLPYTDFCGEGDKRILSVGNLKEFAVYVRQNLQSLQAGESHRFGPGDCRQRLAQRIVHQIAEELGFKSTASCSVEDEDADPDGVTVQRPSEDNNAGDEEESLEQKVSRLFGSASSGRSGRANVFLRNSDLKKFVKEACRARTKRCTPALILEVEQVYDSTLELQGDMGVRVSHGIVLEYFQVFLSKAASSMGWSLIGLLMDLLKWYGEEEEGEEEH